MESLKPDKSRLTTANKEPTVHAKFTPMPMAQLLPGLSGIMSKDAIQTLTARKQPRTTTAYSRTTEKNYKPLTLAELKTALLVLKPESPRRTQALPQSSKKRGWNSSVKVAYKNVSHTANGQMKNNPVRKVLNFQPKLKDLTGPRLINSDTSIFTKPEFRAKKSIHTQALNPVRISGICDIPQTPMESLKPVKSRFTTANKENNSYRTNVKRKMLPPTPKSLIIRRLKKVSDTPLLNSSWKSSDSSFLQKEKEINDVEEKVNALLEEPTLENIAEISPPVSTPFREHRSVEEYFNNTNASENSALYNDNTIMFFDESVHSKEAAKREESVIVSLCDLLKKTTVNNKDIKENTKLETLMEIEKQIKNNMEMLTEIKKAELKSLQNVTKLINEERSKTERETVKTLMQKTPKVIVKTPSPVKSPVTSISSSVIKSPTYKIPKKNPSLRKKFICKSMPDVSTVLSPIRDLDKRTLSMYMTMKDNMKFLKSPVRNRSVAVPDTPGVTSHNLQKQLNKLYNRS